MGSFSQITFADYPIFTNKNWYYEEIVNCLFQPDDFISEKRKYSERNKTVWGDSYEKEKGSFDFKGFKQTVKVCKQRLEIYGISYKKAKADFSNAKKNIRRENINFFSLSGITYDFYLSEIRDIIDKKEKTYGNINHNFRNFLTSGDLAISGQSIDCILYSIFSVLPENAIVEYDLSDVISGGWLDVSIAKFVDYEKIIILTEGKTDAEFISKSIEKLFPHLNNYYHFIDFEEYEVKIESSASALVKLTTSFAAAKVKHPIIVLFDNDTTGLKEMKKLTSLNLPSSIKILKYPDISLAKKYPTIGPTGKKKMNINGFACSIEMYFGVDVLTKDDQLIPIQWKGFDISEQKYQGEIADKKYVQEIFRTKLKTVIMSETKEMTELLNGIFNAYK